MKNIRPSSLRRATQRRRTALMMLPLLLFAGRGTARALPEIIAAAEDGRADRENLREFLSWPLVAVVKAYRGFLGRGVRSTCPMHPSCSTYSLEALESRGWLVGALMTTDRLNRCGHDLRFYSLSEEGGVIKRLDQVGR